MKKLILVTSPPACGKTFVTRKLAALPELKDAKARAEAEKTCAELNALDKIDYEKVNGFKINYLRPKSARIV